jgi:Acetyltransferases
MSVFIRKAEPEDAELLAHLGATTFTEAFGSANTREDLEAYLQSSFSVETIKKELNSEGNLFFLLFSDEEPLAYAKLNLNETLNQLEGKRILQIQRIYARQKALGTGVGARLMKHCLDTARELGKEAVWLSVWQKNSRAIEFYRKWGFKIIGERKFKVGKAINDDYVMSLNLNPPQTGIEP